MVTIVYYNLLIFPREPLLLRRIYIFFGFHLSTRITVFISVVYYLSATYTHPTVRSVFVCVGLRILFTRCLRIVFRCYAIASDDDDDSCIDYRHIYRMHVLQYDLVDRVFWSHPFVTDALVALLTYRERVSWRNRSAHSAQGVSPNLT